MKGIEKQILRVVRELGTARPTSVARHLRVRAAMTEAACNALAEDGYLVRRGEKYVLTDAGRSTVSRAVSRGPIPVLRGGAGP